MENLLQCRHLTIFNIYCCNATNCHRSIDWCVGDSLINTHTIAYLPFPPVGRHCFPIKLKSHNFHCRWYIYNIHSHWLTTTSLRQLRLMYKLTASPMNLLKIKLYLHGKYLQIPPNQWKFINRACRVRIMKSREHSGQKVYTHTHTLHAHHKKTRQTRCN